jgi:hypothetical protein
MHYSVNGAIGYATSKYPDHGFIDLPANPIYSAGVADTNLGAVFSDASGQYWRLSGTNNSATYISKAVGIAQNLSQMLASPHHPLSSSYPAFTTAVSGYDGCYQIIAQQPSGSNLTSGLSNFEDCINSVKVSSQATNPGIILSMFSPNLGGSNAHESLWMGKDLNADSGGIGWGYDPTGTVDYLEIETYGGGKPVRFYTSNFQMDPIAHTVSFSDPVSAGGGTNILYRCTSAGTLRMGQTTTVSADCGSAVDTGLRVN